MSNTAVRIHALGKRYRIGTARKPHSSLREAIVDAAASPWRNLQSLRRLSHFSEDEGEDVVWALRDLDVEVEHGEALGIIGRNGAGKSTLLRILSRITRPSTGTVSVRGRVGALLEVGTGFHPELTGRDNVYLNGAVLGMDKAYIQRRFDEIVSFAGVERYIDTPVKRYSSGMHLRLGFAVAAHLEPDILIVDEVLAVGDADFRRKSFGKMNDVLRDGRTVLLVSHDMSAIQQLCRRSLLLEGGRLAADGRTEDVVGAYLASARSGIAPGLWHDLSAISRQGRGTVRFARVKYSSGQKLGEQHPFPDGPLVLELELNADADRTVTSLAAGLRSDIGVKLLGADSAAVGQSLRLRQGPNRVRILIEQLHLVPGTYYLTLWVADHREVLDHIPAALQITVIPLAANGYDLVPSDGMVTCSFRVDQVTGEGDSMAVPTGGLS